MTAQKQISTVTQKSQVTTSMFEKSFFMRGKKQSISPLPSPNT